MNNTVIAMDSYDDGRTAGMATVFIGLIALIGVGVCACMKK